MAPSSSHKNVFFFTACRYSKSAICSFRFAINLLISYQPVLCMYICIDVCIFVCINICATMTKFFRPCNNPPRLSLSLFSYYFCHSFICSYLRSLQWLHQLLVHCTGHSGGLTKLCKGLAVVLIGGHIVIQVFPSSVSFLALIPAKTIPFAWNLITAGYFEQSLPGVIVSIIGLLFIGKLLEPIWGSREFLKFIFVVNLLTSVCVFITAITLYYVTTRETYLYLPISGFQGILAGFLVGIKQIISDQELSLLKIKAKWLPSLTLLVSILVSFFTSDSASYLPTLVFGTYIGWIYLRYWKTKPETKLRGDPSDEFAFSTFFPEFLRPVIDPVARIFGRMFCGKRSEFSDESRGYTLGGTSLPGSDPIEASRRRERGARALEERLAAERLAASGKAEEAQTDAAETV